MASVPIRTNPDLRPSRLVKSLPGYVLRSAVTIVRSFVTYKPLRFFVGIGALLFAAGFALGLRYLYFAAIGDGDGHVQSVMLSALLIGMGVFTGLIGIVADLIAVNRKLLEKLLARERAAGNGVDRAGATAAASRGAPSRPAERDPPMSVSAPVDPALAGGNHYPKYTVRNPLARRLVARFQDDLLDLAQPQRRARGPRGRLRRGFPQRLLAADGFAVRGSDIAPPAIAAARRRAAGRGLPATFAIADLHELTPERGWRRAGGVLRGAGAPAPIPARALALLARLARPHLIVSVPREPLWRLMNMARGRYWRASATRPAISSTGRAPASSR